jgi:hypothetical protein
MQALIQKYVYQPPEKFIAAILILYFIEIIFGGPGSWSMNYLNVNLRFVFFVLVCICLLSNALIKSRTLRMLDFSVFITVFFLSFFGFLFYL